MGGFKTNLNKKIGPGSSQIIVILFYKLRPDYFFLWEGKAGRGDDPGLLKKFRQGGHMGGFNKYLFLGSFFYLTQ